MRVHKKGRLKQLLTRFLIPRVGISLYYFLRFRARVSPRAEVELTPNIRFGPGCIVSSFSKIKTPAGRIVVGERSGFAAGCFLSTGEGGIHLGKNVICGPHVTIVANNYVFDDLEVPLEDQGATSRGIRIGNNVWIGAGTTILDGSTIGDNTIVVANSLVNRRYPPNCIVQGNPAKVILKRARKLIGELQHA
jgi:acetyltransferase-like isoleucine patch superfamily enzyme